MSRLRNLFRYLLAVAVSVIFLLPLLWIASNSLRPVGLPPPRSVEWWPAQPAWQNYRTIFELLPFARYLRNSLLVSGVTIPVTLATASLAGFAMSQLPARVQRRLLIFCIAVLMIPAASVWIARFQILNWLGLLDSIWALALPAIAASSPLFVLLFYWNFRRIPDELFEYARVEGAPAIMIWWRVALPLARPTIIGVAILTFVMYWSDFISPVLYIFDTTWYTLPVGVQILKQLDPTNWPLLMAGAAFMTLPVLVLFVVLQRYFLHDLSISNLFDRD